MLIAILERSKTHYGEDNIKQANSLILTTALQSEWSRKKKKGKDVEIFV